MLCDADLAEQANLRFKMPASPCRSSGTESLPDPAEARPQQLRPQSVAARFATPRVASPATAPPAGPGSGSPPHPPAPRPAGAPRRCRPAAPVVLLDYVAAASAADPPAPVSRQVPWPTANVIVAEQIGPSQRSRSGCSDPRSLASLRLKSWDCGKRDQPLLKPLRELSFGSNLSTR